MRQRLGTSEEIDPTVQSLSCDGADINLAPANGGTGQKWRLIDAGNGAFLLEPQLAPGRGMDVAAEEPLGERTCSSGSSTVATTRSGDFTSNN